MSALTEMADEGLLRELGDRLAAQRLARNLTQQDVAEQAGLGIRTVQRLEAGEAATHLSGFLRVCRVLGILDNVDALVPAPAPSPIAQLKSQGKQRQRATRVGEKPASKDWTWADDA